jgi:hypothetical protein
MEESERAILRAEDRRQKVLMEFGICKAKQINAASRAFEDTNEGSTNQSSADSQIKPFQSLGIETNRRRFRATIDASNSPVIDVIDLNLSPVWR